MATAARRPRPGAARAARKVEETAETATAQANATMQQFELPKGVRELAERSIEQSRAAYDRFKYAAQETADILEASTTRVADTATALNLKTIDFAKAHVDASFELARKLLKARDLGEAMEIQMDFARRQAAACGEQAKELSDFATKAARDAGGPLTAQMSRSFEQFRTAFTI